MSLIVPQITAAAASVARDLERSDSAFDLIFAGLCMPGGRDGEPAAGDFYDTHMLDEHRLLIAVGDIAGHGLIAGSRMRQLRAAVRRVAGSTSSPAVLLGVLDETCVLGGVDDLATLWVGFYDDDSGLLRYASAGHPPPVFAAIGRPPRLLEAASAPPLGTGAVAGHAQVHELRWPAGALLVAYSDGLVERRERDLEQQIHRLCESVGFFGAALGSQANPRELTEALLAAGVSDLASPTDDICVLVVRRDASTVTADGPPEPVQDVREIVGLR